MKDSNQDLRLFKYWLDCEITLIHIFLAVIIGILIGGTFWYFVGGYITISAVYLFKKAAKLPRNYLR